MFQNKTCKMKTTHLDSQEDLAAHGWELTVDRTELADSLVAEPLTLEGDDSAPLGPDRGYWIYHDTDDIEREKQKRQIETEFV